MIKVGLVGCGYWGSKLARNLSNSKNCEMLACCDLHEEKLTHIQNNFKQVQIATRDYREMIKNPLIDAVVIATQNNTHFPIAKDALLSGKHILVEKPTTLCSKSAEELIKLAKKTNKVLMVDSTFEYNPAVNLTKELIKKGELGKLFSVDMVWTNLGLFQRDANIVWDLMPHTASILTYIIGKKPVSVIAAGQAHIRKAYEDRAYIILEFPQNIHATIHLSWFDPIKIRKVTFTGSKKMLVYDDTHTDHKVRLYDKGVCVKKDKDGKVRFEYRDGEFFSPGFDDEEALSLMVSHFSDSIMNKKMTRGNGKNGLDVIKIIEATQHSIKRGGEKVPILF